MARLHFPVNLQTRINQTTSITSLSSLLQQLKYNSVDLSPVHTGDRVEFNTVDFVESRVVKTRPRCFGPVHTGYKVDRIGNKVERIRQQICFCRFVAGSGNSQLSTKSTVLNSTLSPVCTRLKRQEPQLLRDSLRYKTSGTG